ncbi:MAG: hypothetical protein OEX12_00825 [Gammaproteobacteria bacterium]|nr:hypothetical protein [Gammaproteobacteria bacterium]
MMFALLSSTLLIHYYEYNRINHVMQLETASLTVRLTGLLNRRKISEVSNDEIICTHR